VVVTVLVGVVGSVVVGVRVERIRVRAELAEVREPVVVLVAVRLLDVKRQVELVLPAVRDPVVIAVTPVRRSRRRERQQADGDGNSKYDSCYAHSCSPHWSSRYRSDRRFRPVLNLTRRMDG